jgi:hypothetical protein
MYKNATKCNETTGKWCKTKHGASKIIDTFETYQAPWGSQTDQTQARLDTRSFSGMVRRPWQGRWTGMGFLNLVCLYHHDGLVIDGIMMSTWGGAPVSIHPTDVGVDR